jgi:hypothetical protein
LLNITSHHITSHLEAFMVNLLPFLTAVSLTFARNQKKNLPLFLRTPPNFSTAASDTVGAWIHKALLGGVGSVGIDTITFGLWSSHGAGGQSIFACGLPLCDTSPSTVMQAASQEVQDKLDCC